MVISEQYPVTQSAMAAQALSLPMLDSLADKATTNNMGLAS